MTKDPVDLSVVVPVYGCADCLEALCDRIAAAVAPIASTYEVVLIDDRSPDGAWQAILDLALQQGFIEKKGSWFSYNTMQIGQGREQAKAFLQASSEVTIALELQVRKNLGLVIPTYFS